MGFLIGAYLVIVGMFAGSFINLASDRIPRGESVVAPRSHCRSCGRVLNALDLVPVLGYLARGGRCATCRVSIGVSSPLVEAACGLVMAMGVMWLGLWPGGAVGGAAVVGIGLARTTLSAATFDRAGGA